MAYLTLKLESLYPRSIFDLEFKIFLAYKLVILIKQLNQHFRHQMYFEPVTKMYLLEENYYHF